LLSINKNIKLIVVLASAMLLNACNISRFHKREGAKLVKNKIDIFEKKKSRFYESDLESQTKQKPGVKFLGLVRLNVFFYRLGDASKGDNKLKRILRDDLGRVPVIVDTTMIETSIRAMNIYLKSQGYYYSEISYTVTNTKFLKERKIVTYFIKLNNQFKYAKLNVNCPDKKIYKLVQASLDDSYIKMGKSLKRENLIEEQNRILNLLRNNGYYTFAKEYIDFNVDTNYSSDYVAIEINIKNQDDLKPFKIYKVRNLVINVEPSEKLPGATHDTITTNNFKYIPNGSKINPSIIAKMNFLTKGELFQQNNLSKTYSRLNDLQLFKLVTITPTILENDSDNVIDFSINTPGKISHFGGAFFGLFYGYMLKNGRDLSLISFYKIEKKSKLKVVHHSKNKSEANSENQQKLIDSILDKISKTGYENLSKSEKEVLFKFSNKK
jgi:hypothetical protein